MYDKALHTSGMPLLLCSFAEHNTSLPTSSDMESESAVNRLCSKQTHLGVCESVCKKKSIFLWVDYIEREQTFAVWRKGKNHTIREMGKHQTAGLCVILDSNGFPLGPRHLSECYTPTRTENTK
jgi:hypothetical protein